MSSNKKHTNPIFTPPRIIAASILVLVIAAEVFFDTWCAVQCRRIGYEIVQAESRRDNLTETRKKLMIEQGRLKSPHVLGKKARDEYGLITPEPEQIVVIP
ncbi:MAG: cell division protein FtsL [Desulfobacteraceae bacterium]|nr:cell division protein FtsL [Desulfobacteraceae bacterium]